MSAGEVLPNGIVANCLTFYETEEKFSQTTRTERMGLDWPTP